MPPKCIFPAWPAPANVRALVTTRIGGVSRAPWHGWNLASHVGDDPAAVAENRSLLRTLLPAEPTWLRQVHGRHCVEADSVEIGIEADAAYTRNPGVVCAVLTADCLPLLLCDCQGSTVAAIHAGWRGLAAGVVESAIVSMDIPGKQLMAWLGPAIGQECFEVGEEVRRLFVAHDTAAAEAFVPGAPGKWHCDLYLLARQRLLACGVRQTDSQRHCTMHDSHHFFSYRRDGITGRMASLIWLC